MGAPSSPVAGKVSELTQPVPAVLELASMLEATPMLGSPELPTVGSAQHRLGECKPCAFFWKPAGCSNGVDCVYCHLCDAHEKKRRQKGRRLSSLRFRAARLRNKGLWRHLHDTACTRL